MPIDILSYRGDPGLGLGANPDINANGINLGVLNGTMRDIMLQDNEKNIKLYQQKIKDRDNLENLILQNQVSTKDIQPEDQKYFDDAKANVEKAYTDWGGDMNDVNGIRKYQAAVTDLQDTATHAQTRWAGVKQLQKERSQQTLPNKIKQYDDWISQEKSKPFGQQVVPFQQLHDFSIDDILSGVNPIKGSVVDPNNPIAYDTQTIDYNDILKNKQNQYINDREVADSIDQFTDKLAKYNQPQLQKTIASMDAKISEYNQVRGFQEGDDGFVSPVKVQKADDGTVVLAEPRTELAAKWALANQPQYVTKTPKYNKDVAKGLYDQGRLKLLDERNKIAAAKVGIDAMKAKAYVKHLDAATKKIVDAAQTEGTDITGEYNTFIDNINPGAIDITTGGKKTGSLDAIYMDELPANFQYINGPVVNKDKVTAGKLVPFMASNAGKTPRPYYIPKYVNPQTGEKLDLKKLPSDIQEGLNAAKAQGVTPEDYIKLLLKKGILELQLQGKNGVANYTSLAQSAKVLNNLGGSKKGQENIINAPEGIADEPEPIEETQQPENPENN